MRGILPQWTKAANETLGVITPVLLVPRLGNLMWDGRSSAAANESFLMSALSLAERIMEVIDRRYVAKKP